MTLISAHELAERLNDDAPIGLCDVRFNLADFDQGRREYDAGHLPGAVVVDLHHDLAGGPGGGRHPLPTVASFVDLIGGMGISPGTMVVAYDSAGGGVASRLWWMLRSIGHSQVAVLDGGLPAWVDAGFQLSTDVYRPIPITYPTRPAWTGIADVDTVAESLEVGGVVIDARAPDRFRGEDEPIDPRAGHIPGAINRFHRDNLAADGTHLPVAELAARFADVGSRPIVYCGSGVTACHDLLALSLVGVNQARLYPGSWSEWSSDPDRPAATGD
jgi:thiosulfate/3-mercaptopyruvate sulfurtransferase